MSGAVSGHAVEARRYWRCNTEDFWTAKVTDDWLASALYHKLGYSHQEIKARGLPAPVGPREQVDQGAAGVLHEVRAACPALG